MDKNKILEFKPNFLEISESYDLNERIDKQI